MATLTVEGVPPDLLVRLASAAAASGRSVNSVVILSLVRHLREESPRPGSVRAGTIVCPFGPRVISEAPPGLNVSWGDPG